MDRSQNSNFAAKRPAKGSIQHEGICRSRCPSRTVRPGTPGFGDSFIWPETSGRKPPAGKPRQETSGRKPLAGNLWQETSGRKPPAGDLRQETSGLRRLPASPEEMVVRLNRQCQGKLAIVPLRCSRAVFPELSSSQHPTHRISHQSGFDTAR